MDNYVCEFNSKKTGGFACTAKLRVKTSKALGDEFPIVVERSTADHDHQQDGVDKSKRKYISYTKKWIMILKMESWMVYPSSRSRRKSSRRFQMLLTTSRAQKEFAACTPSFIGKLFFFMISRLFYVNFFFVFAS